jgi:hypothetical protein
MLVYRVKCDGQYYDTASSGLVGLCKMAAQRNGSLEEMSMAWWEPSAPRRLDQGTRKVNEVDDCIDASW